MTRLLIATALASLLLTPACSKKDDTSAAPGASATAPASSGPGGDRREREHEHEGDGGMHGGERPR